MLYLQDSNGNIWTSSLFDLFIFNPNMGIFTKFEVKTDHSVDNLLPADSSALVRQVTSLHLSRLLQNGFLRRNALWQQVYSTRVLTWVQ